jgi:uncharacterized protein YutE (UPF0331/DUF86 family)
LGPTGSISSTWTAVIEQRLARVKELLPSSSEEIRPMTDPSDLLLFHLWQAVQAAIDLAVAACVHFRLGAPRNDGEAFQRLAQAGFLDPGLAGRLVQAVGFRNAVAHAYHKLDMERVYRAAKEGPADLRAFLAALAKRLE